MPKYLLCWPGRQGVREKCFTAKGVRNPKSLGTAALCHKLYIPCSIFESTMTAIYGISRISSAAKR